MEDGKDEIQIQYLMITLSNEHHLTYVTSHLKTQNNNNNNSFKFVLMDNITHKINFKLIEFPFFYNSKQNNFKKCGIICLSRKSNLNSKLICIGYILIFLL